MHNVLDFLKMPRDLPPTLDTVRRLLHAYVHSVPWGSATRIARAATLPLSKRPRDSAAFWQEALTLGAGGTCFESNGAFFALLQYLGYDGYLTINNMGDTVGCHSAIVLHLNGTRWLVDVGLPIDVPISLQPDQITVVSGTIHDYACVPTTNPARFEIMRSHHPRPNAFTLVDEPVAADTYWEHVVADHGPGGLFLDQVILSKIIDGTQWRYNGRADGHTFEVFHGRGDKATHPITGDVAAALSERFGIDRDLVQTALDSAAQR
jgi:arylamine N-acetyltransferase